MLKPFALNAAEVYQNTSQRIHLSDAEKAWINENPIINVGVGNWAPIDFSDNNGKPQGIAKDYVNLVSRQTGLTFNYEKSHWQETLTNLENNDIQLILGMYKNKKREEKLTFSSPYYNVVEYFFINKNLPFESIDDLNTYTLAIPKGYEQIPYLKRHFPGIKLLETDNLDSAIDAVIEGKAHILFESYSILSYILDTRNITLIKPFRSTRQQGERGIHLATNNQNSTLISIINKVLNNLTVSENRAIQQRWFNTHKNSLFTLFSEQQKQWINDNPVIYYGARKDWVPYDFSTIANEHAGLSNDYLNIISQYTGLNFQPEYDDWDKLIYKAKNNKIDILPTMYYDQSYNSFLHYSASYQQLEDYYFIRSDVNAKTLNDLNNKSLIIIKHQHIESAITQQFPTIKTIEVDTLSNAVDMILEGRAEGIYYDYYALSAYLKKHNISTIKPFAPAKQKHPIFMAVTHSNKELISIINTVLQHIDNAQKTIIYEQWANYQHSKNTKKITLNPIEKKWLKNNPIINISSYASLLPYEGFDDDNHYEGIIADYLALMSEKLNVQFNAINTHDKNEALIELVTGDVDVISTNNQEIETLSTTNPYEKIPLVMVMKDNNKFIHSIHELKNKNITLIKNTNYSKAIENDYPTLDFQYEEDITAALTAVSIGRSDVLIAPISQASYYISKIQLHNLSIVGTTPYSIELTFAVLPANTVLRDILNKTLSNITQQEKQIILNKWGKKEVVKEINYQLIIITIVILLIIITIFVSWNKRLRIEIERRKATELQTKMIIDHIPQRIIIWDHSGNLITANKKVLIDYQTNKDDIKSFHISSFYENPLDRDKVKKALQEFGHVKEMIIPFKGLNNEVNQMMTSIIPITYRNEPALLSIAVDLTQRLEMEQALEQAKHKAEIANQAKSEFLANMSHEIRTPMNAVIGFTELLQEQLTDPKSLSFIHTIKSAGQSLLTLINDILDLSKVEAGQLNIINEPTNIHYLFKEIGDVFTLKVKDKSLDLLIDVDKNIPDSLFIDKTRLRQVLFNIIGNAVKFTDAGEIKVTVTAQNSENNNTLINLNISIQDSGIGIPEEEQENIFKSFQQQEGQSVRKYGGTGLGLSISKRLIKLMGGRLFVKSRLNEGACFYINLPDIELSLLDDDSHNRKPTNDNKKICFKNSTVLIVDDIKDNRDLLKESFKKLSITGLIAKNGQEATDMVNSHTIDLILMDIRMPVMDGYQAAKIIKKTHPNIPILALTASVMRDDYEIQRRDNFLGYLRKPILQHELINELIKYLPYQTIIKQEITSEDPLHIVNHELIEECIELFSLQCAEIQKSNAMKDITAFAKALYEWAEKHNEESVLLLSKDLVHAVDIFDIQKIKTLLNTFMSFINPNA